MISHPKGNVLFDVGLHPRCRREIDDSPNVLTVRTGPSDDAVSQLGIVGLAPAYISHVIVSHLHYDHAGGLQYFPEAKIVVQETELLFAESPPVYQKDLFDRADFDHDLH